jgi:pyridoxamine 5'-phosphate oxidase
MEHLRKEYSRDVLNESNVHENPLEQFKIWFDECLNTGTREANAMVLSTVGHDLKPSSRVVLLKNVQEDGFVFYTNYLSKKGQQLFNNPNACLLFFWDVLERQVRIEGLVKTIAESISDNYFYSRPVLSQIGAMISTQSQKIQGRAELEEKFEYYKAHPEQIRRPEHWGGFCLVPDYFEFWQGRESRLHDRLIYERSGSSWTISRLAP